MAGDPSSLVSSNFNFKINRCNNETESLKVSGVTCKLEIEITEFTSDLNLNFW